MSKQSTVDVGMIFFILVIWVIVAVWLTMLGLGVLHSVVPAVPALGYSQSFWVWLGLKLISMSTVAKTPNVKTT